MPAADVYAVLNGAAIETDLGSGWDAEDLKGDSTGPSEVDSDDQIQPELQPIALPSTLGERFIRQHCLWDLATKERQLREGHMNDALQGIRTGIGYKSLLYRTKIRKAPSYRSRLRSFDDIHVAEEGVRKHVRLYMQSRAAAERLFDTQDPDDLRERTSFQAKYKAIVKEDLRVETAVIESFTQGVRNISTAWFWHGPVRKMLWLRAYARKLRWDEELVIVLFEMDCTVWRFEKMAADWTKWGTAPRTPGHRSYAAKQTELWRELALHARVTLNSVLANVQPAGTAQ
ncbi:hypothetical protein C8Q80DRAFT_1111992 [Daedaleopsis nitida]|nr:hypothetical protein C8Q80DRAFT_1111992 [Daedaleopsis nitida]